MNEAEKKHTEKKRGWIKWVIILLVLILIMSGLRLSLKSDLLLNYIRDQVEQQASAQLNGSLTVESMNGDLLHGFTLIGVELRDDSEQQIATIDSASVSYSIMDLIRSPYTVESLSVDGVQAFINQEQDSVWNVMNLIPAQPEPDESESTLEWEVQDISVQRMNVDVTSDYVLPDGFVNIRGLNFGGSAGMSDSGYFGSVRSLEFSLEEDRLPEDIRFVMSAGAEKDGKITLESLVINTGRSMLNASSEFELPDEITGSAQLLPLDWRDIAAYVENLPLEQNLQIEVGAEGTFADLNVNLTASAPGLEELTIQSGVSLGSEFSLNRLDLHLQNLDTPQLTGLEGMPVLGELTFTGNGLLKADEIEEATWAGEVRFSDFSYETYSIDGFEADYDINRDQGQLTATIRKQSERVDLTLSAQKIWDDNPVWSGTIETQNMNLATWLNDSALESQLNIRSTFSGVGIEPQNFQAIAEINIEDSRYGNQPFSELMFRGNINSQSLNGNLSARLDRSNVTARFQASDWRENPSYRFDAVMREFNLSELSGLEQFPTYLNGTLRGEGRGFDPETLQLQAEAALDSSVVNKEPIDTLKANFSIENQFLTVENAQLVSPIADGEFSLRQHITDLANLENRLNFSAELKDLQPLAPLFELDRLESGGVLSGTLNRSGSGFLEFNGEAELQNIVVDSLFSANSINGSATVRLLDDIEADIDVQINSPVVNEIGVQDINFSTRLVQQESSTSGQFDLEIINEEICTLYQEGEFNVDSNRLNLRTTLFDFTTQIRTLSLDNSFDFEYNFETESARMDTMTVRDAEDQSFLSLWVTQLSADVQEFGLEAGELNLGAIQSLVLEEPMVEGYLSGETSIYNSSSDLVVSTNGSVQNLEFEEGEMDRFNFYLNIEDEWLQLTFGGIHKDKKLFETLLQVPFLPGDPATFDDQFFDREVSGYFELSESDLSYWLSFISELDSEDTQGKISLRADLAGIAGNPELTGNLHIENGLFSGINIDRADFDLNYIHDEEYVELGGVVEAAGNPVLDMDAKLPFIVDIRSAEVLLPDDDDEVSVNFRTENFNLAIFNDFLDREMFRQLRGSLNGEVSLKGRLADLQTSGRMELTGGNLRVVPAGITLSGMASVVNFTGSQVELQEFRMQSGPGQIRASGSVEMNNLTPGTLQLNIRGNQFRVANTSEYNALIDLNADLSGTVSEPRLTGNLTFLNGFVNLQNFGERSVEDVQLDDEEEPEPIEFYELLEMEMNVNFAREFFIRNRQYLDMEIELGGEVDLVKRRNNDLQMFGSLEGVRGYARPLGKQFQLDEAFVTFYGPVDDPELNIRTLFEPPQSRSEVQIYYIIEGTVQDPEFRFDSDPPLELQDIISYTLFGKPFYELESWEQVVAGSGSSPSAADIALDVLLDRVELLASQSLGIDVVQIDNTRSGSDSSTSIKTGWYLNRRTFFAIVNEISSSRPNTLFMLEYLLKENLELIITQGDDSREGIDLRWHYDY